jgi:ABC-type multidrug transport system fused ATPase/permease subunit
MLSYALKATQSLTFAIRASTALENCFTSCDRVKEYIDIEQEVNLSESAPAVGFDGNTPHLIAANNIRFRYAAGLPLSINNISFHINKGELIGLCGRTGSGKSTISYILARAMAVEAGSTVTLRGNDIYSLPLLEYRKDVQSFPQNSYIFSGTIRSYLDPYKSHSDVKMNNVLQELHQALRNEDSGRINLDFTINSGSSTHLLTHSITHSLFTYILTHSLRL